MAQFNSKHGKREQSFFIRSLHDGLNQEVSPSFLPITALTRCKNMRYVFNKSVDGQQVVAVAKRQGTEKISATALASAMKACTYYIAGAQYIVATASKVYYLDGSYLPVEIGSISGVPTFSEFHGKLIIHDSGTMKAWNGTTFETLNCLYKNEIIGTGNNSDVDFSGTLAHPAAKSASLTITYTDGTLKTITSAANGTLSGDVAAHELMPNQVDRDFSGASAWANGTLNAYDETGDLTITANGVGQYCTCPVLSAPTTIGKRYRMTFAVANLVSTWTIKSFDGTQTIGTVSASGAQSFDWTATTAGGFMIVAVAANSSGDFDNFTLTTNVVDFTTGVFSFRASGAPDNATSVYAEYEKVGGAPKSKAGFVRASRLYAWGDADNPSRLWYCGPNDEDGWDSSSSGGYLDVNPLDGYSLIGCAKYFQMIVAIKGNSIHRIPDFPGDSTFRVEPLMENTGALAYRTVVNDGTMISFLSKGGWNALSSTQLYGDIQKAEDLSLKFRANATTYATVDCYSEYNQNDKQLWLTLYSSGTQWETIYVINLETGGQVSQYQFKFAHTCYTFVNGEMLIGGADGHLYRMYAKGVRYTDNNVSYTTDTAVRGVMTDFGLGFNRKHNKRIFPHFYGPQGFSATLNLYTDGDYSTIRDTTTISISGGDQLIWDDQTSLIWGDTGIIGLEAIAERSYEIHKKFNYHEVLFELINIEGSRGAEFYGLDFTGAVVGA